MEKQIYLIAHNTNPNYRYVGATVNKLSDHFASVWSKRYQSERKTRPLMLAMRGTWRSEWSITLLEDYTVNWQELEKHYIKKEGTYKKGLNACPHGDGTGAHNQAMCKKVYCSNGLSYVSAHEASRKTGIERSSINRCARGEYNLAGGLKWSYENNL